MFKINIFNKTILGFLTVLIVLLVYFLIVYQPDCNNENTIKKKTGIGKFCYNDDEVFTSISEIKSPKGHAAATMINGYLLTVYSSDGGGSYKDGGIDFWNISDPRNPILASRYDDENTKLLREAHSYGLAKIDNKTFLAVQSITGIQIWDVTNPLKAFHVSSLKIPGIEGGDYTGIWWLSWQSPYLYLAGTTTGIYTVDTRDLKNPVVINRMTTKELGGINPSVVYASGNNLVGMESLSGKLFSVDISNPREPSLRDIHNGVPGYSGIYLGNEFITVSGDIAIGGNGDIAGMYRYKIDKYGKISFLGGTGINLEDGGYGSYQDNYFMAGYSDSFAKFDKNKNYQIKKGKVKNIDADQDFAVMLGNIAFISDDHGFGSSIIVHDKFPDQKPPKVIWTSTDKSESDVAITSPIGVSFSDQIDLKNLNSKNFIVKDENDNQINGYLSLQGNLVNFVPKNNFKVNTVYTLHIKNLEDISGNKMKPYISKFKTSKDSNYLVNNCKIIAQNPTLLSKEVKFNLDIDDYFKDGKFKWFLEENIIETNSKKTIRYKFNNIGRQTISVEIYKNEKKIKCASVHIVYDENQKNLESVSSSPMIFASGNIFTVNSDNDSVTMIKNSSTGNKYECEIPVGKNQELLHMSMIKINFCGLQMK